MRRSSMLLAPLLLVPLFAPGCNFKKYSNNKITEVPSLTGEFFAKIKKPFEIDYIDFNNDNINDVLSLKKDPGELKYNLELKLGNTRGFNETRLLGSFYRFPTHIRLADINSDGLLDIVIWNNLEKCTYFESDFKTGSFLEPYSIICCE